MYSQGVKRAALRIERVCERTEKEWNASFPFPFDWITVRLGERITSPGLSIIVVVVRILVVVGRTFVGVLMWLTVNNRRTGSSSKDHTYMMLPLVGRRWW